LGALSSLTTGAGNGSFLNRFFEARAASSHKAQTLDADAIDAANNLSVIKPAQSTPPLALQTGQIGAKQTALQPLTIPHTFDTACITSRALPEL
jgi:hypothetical protein